MKNWLIVFSLLLSAAAHADTLWPEDHPDNAYTKSLFHLSKSSSDSWEIDLFVWYQEGNWWLKVIPIETSKNSFCFEEITAVQDKTEYDVRVHNPNGLDFSFSPCQNRVTEVYRLVAALDPNMPFTLYYYDSMPDTELVFNADASDFADFMPPEPESTTRLSNISARGRVDSAPDLLYGGFIVTGEGTATIYIKGGAVDDGLDTTLRIVDSEGNTIAENDDWQSDVRMEEVPDYLKPKKLTDSGLLLDLKAGTYNALVSAKGKEGHAIVSVWEVK